ncbi:MAG: hypothetical protein V1865_03055 [bacterium]
MTDTIIQLKLKIMNKFLKLGLIVIGMMVIINLIILDLFIFNNRNINQLPNSSIINEQIQPTPVTYTCDESCSQEIQDQVLQAVASLSGQPKPTSAPAPKSKNTVEAYIPIGTGRTSNIDWTEIPGAEVYIDTTKYGTIKEAYFEAQLHLPTGNGIVCVRLYNPNNKTSVPQSELCSTSGPGERLSSPKINLYTGYALYRIQLKVSMPPYEGVLDSARIKLIYEQ